MNDKNPKCKALLLIGITIHYNHEAINWYNYIHISIKFIDINLGKKYLKEETSNLAHIALDCTNEVVAQRLPISVVLQELARINGKDTMKATSTHLIDLIGHGILCDGSILFFL